MSSEKDDAVQCSSLDVCTLHQFTGLGLAGAALPLGDQVSEDLKPV